MGRKKIELVYEVDVPTLVIGKRCRLKTDAGWITTAEVTDFRIDSYGFKIETEECIYLKTTGGRMYFGKEE